MLQGLILVSIRVALALICFVLVLVSGEGTLLLHNSCVPTAFQVNIASAVLHLPEYEFPS